MLESFFSRRHVDISALERWVGRRVTIVSSPETRKFGIARQVGMLMSVDPDNGHLLVVLDDEQKTQAYLHAHDVVLFA